MLGPQPAFPVAAGIVEIFEIAGAHVDRADRDARLATIEPLEIHQLFERRLHRRRVVVADLAGRLLDGQPGRRQARPEEAGLALEHGPPGLEGAEALARFATEPGDPGVYEIGHGPHVGRRAADRLPEFAQAERAVGRRIAGDDRGVEGTDRDARYPVGRDAGLVESLETPAC